MVMGCLQDHASSAPQLWPLIRLPRLGDPSEPSLAPDTVEPIAPCSSNPTPDPPAGRAVDSPDTPVVPSLANEGTTGSVR